MANFSIALEKTLKHEGGYANDPNDPGGETFCGISRRAWPNWEGWAKLDTLFESGVSPTEAGIETLKMVSDFYRLNFWTPLHGDEIESQEIANYLFDFAVNSGIGDAVKALQKALNDCYETDLDVDGVWGNDTSSEFFFWQNEDMDGIGELVVHLRVYRLAHYMDCIADNPKLARFARGWKTRALA